MILGAFVVSTPLTYLFLSNWLENFAYRIPINPLVFILGGVIAFTIAILTVSYHVIRAALANPVHSLKYE